MRLYYLRVGVHVNDCAFVVGSFDVLYVLQLLN